MVFFDSFKKIVGIKPKVCKLCSKENPNYYMTSQGEEINLCRQHLVEKFQQSFNDYPHHSIVCMPFYDEKTAIGYTFLSSDKFIRGTNEQNQASDHLLEFLKNIYVNNCSVCGQKAWNVFLTEQETYEDKMISSALLKQSFGIYLCRDHAFDRIKEVLLAVPYTFEIFEPSGGEGIFYTTDGLH